MSYNLAIIEDSISFSNQLKEFLQLSGHTVNLQALSAQDYLTRSRSMLEKVELIILDLSLLDGESGLDYLPVLKKEFPDVEVIVVTSHDDSEHIFSALQSGANGYVVKGSALSDIDGAIHMIKNGGSFMSPSIARKVMEYFKGNKVTETVDLDVLTSREKEIAENIKDGLSYKLIAEALEISIETVRFHIKNIYKKLQVNSKAEVVSAFYKSKDIE